MNPRILKKLSKKAEPLLRELDGTRRIIILDQHSRHDSYEHFFPSSRKHWERNRCHENYQPTNQFVFKKALERKYKTKAGNWIVLRPPSVPLKGTYAVEFISSGEFEQDTLSYAWHVLIDIVEYHFTDTSKACHENDWAFERTRNFKTAKDYLNAARDIIQMKKEKNGN